MRWLARDALHLCIVAILAPLTLGQSAPQVSSNSRHLESGQFVVASTYAGVSYPDLFFTVLGDRDLTADAPANNNSNRPPSMDSASESPAHTGFNWRAATLESLLFTGIMHSYNIGTEAATRDALTGTM